MKQLHGYSDGCLRFSLKWAVIDEIVTSSIPGGLPFRGRDVVIYPSHTSYPFDEEVVGSNPET